MTETLTVFVRPSIPGIVNASNDKLRLTPFHQIAR